MHKSSFDLTDRQAAIAITIIVIIGLFANSF